MCIEEVRENSSQRRLSLRMMVSESQSVEDRMRVKCVCFLFSCPTLSLSPYLSLFFPP